MLYIWSFVSFVLLTRLKRGHCYIKHSLVQKTALNVETSEEIELDNTKIKETNDIAIQTSIILKKVTSPASDNEVVEIFQDVSCQTLSRNELKKSVEFLSLVELAEAFN